MIDLDIVMQWAGINWTDRLPYLELWECFILGLWQRGYDDLDMVRQVGGQPGELSGTVAGVQLVQGVQQQRHRKLFAGHFLQHLLKHLAKLLDALKTTCHS